MKSIEEKINYFKENLELFDDDMDKSVSYTHLTLPTKA